MRMFRKVADKMYEENLLIIPTKYARMYTVKATLSSVDIILTHFNFIQMSKFIHLIQKYKIDTYESETFLNILTY